MQRGDSAEIRRKRQEKKAKKEAERKSGSVVKRQRRKRCSRRWDAPYVVHVGNGDEAVDDWGRYLKRMTSRPGWSVARLARESGVNRTTIFNWIKEGGGSLAVASVMAISRALGDPETALLAAGNLLSRRERQDADDVIRLVHNSGLSAQDQADLLQDLMDRRRRTREQEMADIQRMINLARRERGDAAAS